MNIVDVVALVILIILIGLGIYVAYPLIKWWHTPHPDPDPRPKPKPQPVMDPNIKSGDVVHLVNKGLEGSTDPIPFLGGDAKNGLYMGLITMDQKTLEWRLYYKKAGAVGSYTQYNIMFVNTSIPAPHNILQPNYTFSNNEYYFLITLNIPSTQKILKTDDQIYQSSTFACYDDSTQKIEPYGQGCKHLSTYTLKKLDRPNKKFTPATPKPIQDGDMIRIVNYGMTGKNPYVPYLANDNKDTIFIQLDSPINPKGYEWKVNINSSGDISLQSQITQKWLSFQKDKTGLLRIQMSTKQTWFHVYDGSGKQHKIDLTSFTKLQFGFPQNVVAYNIKNKKILIGHCVSVPVCYWMVEKV